MMQLPPIAALRALEVVSRHLSFTKAANELYITQSAVSHQIRHLEKMWGFKLFDRQPRRLIITNEGQMIVPIVREFLGKMNRALNEIQNVEADSRPSIRVSLIQSLAIKWLVPRLGRFTDAERDVGAERDINVWVSTTDSLVDFDDDEVDMAIRLGHGEWPDLNVELMFNEYVFPVCSPEFMKRNKPPKSPRDLLDYPLLYRHSRDICPRWRDWFRDAGIDVTVLPGGSRFPDTGMAVQAAIDHQGIALARSAHVEADLASGRLVKLFDVYSLSTVSYYLVCQHAKLKQPHIAAFRQWLLKESALSQKSFDAVGKPMEQVAAEQMA